MERKLPPEEAFSIYFGLGVKRSYQAVADHFRVSKKAVTSHAVKHRWQERVAELEEKVRQANEERAVETAEEMVERHLTILKIVQRRALEALRSTPLTNPMHAIRALEMTMKQEREIRSLPTERGQENDAENVAAKIRKFLRASGKLMRVEDEGEVSGNASCQELPDIGSNQEKHR